MTDALAKTVILDDSSGHDTATDEPPLGLPDPAMSRVAVGTSETESRMTSRFQEATRQLLRKRLMIAFTTLIAIISTVTLVFLLLTDVQATAFTVRVLSIALQIGLLIFLYRTETVSLRLLRRIEFSVVAIPVLAMMVSMVSRSRYLIDIGTPEVIHTLHSAIGAAVSLVIAIYGFFIPNRWQRTAMVTGLAAVTPGIVILTHPVFEGYVDFSDPMFLATPLLTLAMAAVATLAAHVVHALRRETEKARQYGQYRLTEELGHGAMGVVYKAEHRLLKRPAAIKLIHPESSGNEDAIGNFEREVQISATLSHWNTVQIYDYGRTDVGDFYYVMEYLQGESLAQRLEHNGSLSVADTIEIIRQLCDGLWEAHRQGMVHRDIKPSNIFLANIGGHKDVVKVLDFGLAVAQSANATRPGPVSGTPYYMPPEQIRGEQVSGQSDIYSIGCVMFECLTGSPPFKGQSISDIFDQHAQAELPLDLLPDDALFLRNIVETCLQKTPGKRFASVQMLKAQCLELATATTDA
jgi:serine/threonine-protein kinase